MHDLKSQYLSVECYWNVVALLVMSGFSRMSVLLCQKNIRSFTEKELETCFSNGGLWQYGLSFLSISH